MSDNNVKKYINYDCKSFFMVKRDVRKLEILLMIQLEKQRKLEIIISPRRNRTKSTTKNQQSIKTKISGHFKFK